MAVVSHHGRAMIGWILRLQIYSVFTILTHAHSNEGNVSCISGGKKNFEPKKQAYPQILVFFIPVQKCETVTGNPKPAELCP